MLNIKINGKEMNVKDHAIIQNLIDNPKDYYLASVNNRIRELTYPLQKNCTINLLDLKSKEAVRTYEGSLRYLFAMAFENLYPNSTVEFNYSISRSIMCLFTNVDEPIDINFTKKIQSEMERLVSLDLPIKRKRMPIDDAIKLYKEKGYKEKVEILKYREEQIVNVYECQNYINYMFGYMVPSTGYLDRFILKPYYPGVILQYPRADSDGEIPSFEDAPVYSNTLFEASKWSKICAGDYIADMNKHVENGTEIDFINMCETKHNNMLAEIGDRIKKDGNIRLVAIAGPSSSGKTTFAMRLKIELMTRGYKPVLISIDNYYNSVKDAPLDDEGKPDLEHIEALDIDLFNHDMLALIQGEEVTLPVYDFKSVKRIPGNKVKLGVNEPIIIEGIHALNERMTSLIPRSQKFKIYIAPQIQMHIDNHNPINMTDIRLLRRLVRDKNYRGTNAKETLAMWQSVRRGEFRWIYPTQEDANFVYNSELSYELCVMKKYALPMLEAIPRDDEFFIQANRLFKFLKYFKDIDDKWIPCNSLIREFIGGSCFHV